MPDLSNKGVHKFWHEYHDPMIYKDSFFYGKRENWSLDDNPELEAAIAKFSTILDDIGYIDSTSRR